jgi:hypothetical protein
MQSLKTLYRLAVMSITVAIFVMAWRLYGPTAKQTKAFALTAMEWAETQLRGTGPDAQSSATPPRAAPSATVLTAAPPQLLPARANEPVEMSPSADGARDVDRLSASLARLEEAGARNAKVTPWGHGGRLYRCTCQAAWGGSPQFGRHFESVADQPEKAVDDVLAQIEAWRTAERGVSSIR